MTYWKSGQFKELQQEWYQRLQENGFRDHEKFVGNNSELIQFSVNAYKSMDAVRRENKATYFSLLSQNLHYAEFASEVDELILTWFADGKKIKLICEELERRGERRCRGTIRYTIRKYEMKWGMRVYTPKQLNQKK
jgi:hypothetical protein